LVCCSKNLIHELYISLKNLGFKCIEKEDKKQANQWAPLCSVKLSGGIQVNKWFEMIGSKNTKHIIKYSIWKQYGFCPPKTKLNERRQILKKEIFPYDYYKRECRSGQTGLKDLKNLGHAKDQVA